MIICQIGIFNRENKTTRREPKAIGGISNYISDLIGFLINKNCKLIFIGKIYSSVKSHDLTYYQIQRNIRSTNSFLIHLFLKSCFIKINSESIIHAHRPDHLAVFIPFRKNLSVITLHGQQAHTVNSRKNWIIRKIYKTLEAYAFEKATFLVAVDKVTKAFYTKLYPEYQLKMRVIPTGVDLNQFNPIHKKNSRDFLGLSEVDKVVVFVGRIEPPKRITEIIQAFNLLAKENINYKLLIVGDGIQMDAMKEYTRKCGLNNSVQFLGIRKRSELAVIYSASDISVLYSGNEGSPLSVKESLACGIPVVANDVGDISEIVIDGVNGYIVRNESITDLAKIIKLCIMNANNMKVECVKSIFNYSTEKVNQQVLELYLEMIHGNSSNLYNRSRR